MTVAKYRYVLFYNVIFVSTGIADLPTAARRSLPPWSRLTPPDDETKHRYALFAGGRGRPPLPPSTKVSADSVNIKPRVHPPPYVISTEANGASRERSGEISRERNATIVHEYRNLLPLGSPSNVCPLPQPFKKATAPHPRRERSGFVGSVFTFYPAYVGLLTAAVVTSAA